MALDTAAKRESAMNPMCPWRGVWPLPDALGYAAGGTGLAVTLGAVTLAATGTVAVTGSAALTLGAVTSAEAVAAVLAYLVPGGSYVNEATIGRALLVPGGVYLNTSGPPTLLGTAALTLDALTLAAAGTVTQPPEPGPTPSDQGPGTYVGPYRRRRRR